MLRENTSCAVKLDIKHYILVPSVTSVAAFYIKNLMILTICIMPSGELQHHIQDILKKLCYHKGKVIRKQTHFWESPVCMCTREGGI